MWHEKTSAWQKEILNIGSQLKAHSNSNYSYLDQGAKIIELARNAYPMYLQQEPAEKRKLLQILLSNCTLNGCDLHYNYKKPFDILIEGSNRRDWLGS